MTSRVIRHVIPRIQRVVMGSGFMWPALEASSMEESGVMMIPEVAQVSKETYYHTDKVTAKEQKRPTITGRKRHAQPGRRWV
jgi:hypothetical protein